MTTAASHDTQATDGFDQQQPCEESQESDHLYSCPPIYEEKHAKLKEEVNQLQQKVDKLESDLRRLQLEKQPMSIDDIKHDDSKVMIYNDLFLQFQNVLKFNAIESFIFNVIQEITL